MKYRDLIEKLLPFADEEINLTVSHEQIPADALDLENWDEIVMDKVSFFRNTEDSNDIICSVKQTYDSESFDNIGEAEILAD